MAYIQNDTNFHRNEYKKFDHFQMVFPIEADPIQGISLTSIDDYLKIWLPEGVSIYYGNIRITHSLIIEKGGTLHVTTLGVNGKDWIVAAVQGPIYVTCFDCLAEPKKKFYQVWWTKIKGVFTDATE